MLQWKWRIRVKVKVEHNVPKRNTRISAGTEKHSMGGGVWEQTNLGGVKVWGDSCGGQATSGMCRRLRSTTVRWFPPTRPWIPVLGVYIFSPCCVAFAWSSLSFFLRALSGVFLFLTLVYCYLQDLCSFLKAALLGLPWRLDLGAALEIWLCCAGFMVKLVLF